MQELQEQWHPRSFHSDSKVQGLHPPFCPLSSCSHWVGPAPGIEAEASMLGAPMSMVLPSVVGYRLTGTLPVGTTATDLVLTDQGGRAAFKLEAEPLLGAAFTNPLEPPP